MSAKPENPLNLAAPAGPAPRRPAAKFWLRIAPDMAVSCEPEGWWWTRATGFNDGLHRGFVHGGVGVDEQGRLEFGPVIAHDDQGWPPDASFLPLLKA